MGCLPSHQRSLIGSGHHEDGFRQAFLTKIVLNEFLNFASTLANKTNHRDIALGVSREHGKQHGLANPGAGENAHALALAAGNERIEGFHPQVYRLTDPFALMRGRRASGQSIVFRTRNERPLAIDRFAERIDDASKPGR